MSRTIYCLLFLFPFFVNAQYTGTASVTQGLGSVVASNIYTCTNGRIANIGTITATDNTVWTVPAEVNFTNSSFPFASDLHNSCTGATFANDVAALAALNGSDIVTVDSGGELITAFIFADNYFEMYINGTPVGKDNVPYTQFNSNIVRFRVNRPFTIAMLLVDWEENLGLGSENSGGFQYHDGDGGMAAVFKDSGNAIIAVTDANWRAQTFYTSPIVDLTCPTENGTSRISSACSTQDSNNGLSYYGLHWSRPANWTDETFNDSSWPQATTYTNAAIGVNNKPAYTNFINVFDDPSDDAQFIWSTNVILDNEVIVRQTVLANTTGLNEYTYEKEICLYPNPAQQEFQISFNGKFNSVTVERVSILNSYGEILISTEKRTGKMDVSDLSAGFYFVRIQTEIGEVVKKLIIKN